MKIKLKETANIGNYFRELANGCTFESVVDEINERHIPKNGLYSIRSLRIKMTCTVGELSNQIDAAFCALELFYDTMISMGLKISIHKFEWYEEGETLYDRVGEYGYFILTYKIDKSFNKKIKILK